MYHKSKSDGTLVHDKTTLASQSEFNNLVKKLVMLYVLSPVFIPDVTIYDVVM